VVPFRTPAHAGKSGAVARRGRSFLAPVSPYISLIRGADGGAAHCCHEHEGPTLSFPCLVPAGGRVHVIGFVGRVFVMDEVDDVELLVERIAALDLGKAGLEACVRVPHSQRPGRRMQELRGYGTTTAQLLAMVAWLRHWQVQRVVMESTSTYWKGVYYLLEAEGFDCWLVNAREVKNVPGRAKTDLLTELPRVFRCGCVLRGVGLARFAARDGRWRSAAGFGGAGGAGAGCFGGHRRSVSAVSAG